MGCGASKAARVSGEEISIVDHPARRSCETEQREGAGDGGRWRREGGEGERGGGLEAVYSAQSEIERAVREATSSSTATPSFSSAVAAASREGPQTVPPSLSAPLVFEVCMSPDDRLEARVSAPARLKKLESAPVVTKEMLEMKQYRVAERKKVEQEKRLERSRMSRKDRLRKEIMAARVLNPAESEEEVVLTESFSYSRLREEEGGGGGRGVGGGLGERGGREGGERGALDTSAGMEGDTRYNTEQSGEFWEASQTEDQSRPHPQTPTSLDNSTSNLEQFM